METDNYCVYILTCTVTGLKYVGKTNNLKRRLDEHVRDARNGSAAVLHQAIREHGWKNFEHSVYKSDLSLEDAMLWEVMMINKLDTRNGRGYNMTGGGDNDG